MAGWLSLSRARWLLWCRDRGLWWTPLGDPQKAASPPSLACHSPHLGPAVTPCGRAAVNCGCWLVKRRSEGSRLHISARELSFSAITTRGYSVTAGWKGDRWKLGSGVSLVVLFLSPLHGQHFFTGSMREVGCVCQRKMCVSGRKRAGLKVSTF